MAVGVNTQHGKTEKMLMGDQENTPLQDKLETIANQIGLLGLAVAILTFLALAIRGSITIAQEQKPFFSVDTLNGLINAFILGVTIIVVAVPEGLPLAVTISLAYSVGEMFKENNLVRKLHSSETMGGANEICSDKTGTLTQNKMTVMQLYTKGKELKVKHDGTDKLDPILQEACLYNSTAFFETDKSGKKVTKGNPTEQGILKYMMACNANVDEIFGKKEAAMEFNIPFSSERKRATVVIRNERTNMIHVFVKGGAELCLEFCDSILGEMGEDDELTPEMKI